MTENQTEIQVSNSLDQDRQPKESVTQLLKSSAEVGFQAAESFSKTTEKNAEQTTNVTKALVSTNKGILSMTVDLSKSCF